MQIVYSANAKTRKPSKSKNEILRAKAIELAGQLNSKPCKISEKIIAKAKEMIDKDICNNQS